MLELSVGKSLLVLFKEICININLHWLAEMIAVTVIHLPLHHATPSLDTEYSRTAAHHKGDGNDNC